MIHSHIRRHFLCLLLIQFSIAAASAAENAKLLSVTGQVALERTDESGQRRSIQGKARTGVSSRDLIRTGDQGAASLMVGNSLVYLGAETTAQILMGEGQPTLQLHSGQVRAVITGQPGLRIVSTTTDTLAVEGILRVAVEPSATRVASEQGLAQVQHPSAQSQNAIALTSYAQLETTTLQPGQQVVIPSASDGSGDAAPVVIEEEQDEQDTIDVESLQQQAADSAQVQQQNQFATTPTSTTRGAGATNQRTTPQNNNIAAAPGLGFGFGAFASASSLPAFGGLTADFNQRTDNGKLTVIGNGVDEAVVRQVDPAGPDQNLIAGGVFKGSIQFVTSENRTINDVGLENDLPSPQFWSIANFTSNNADDYDLIVSDAGNTFSNPAIEAVDGSVIRLSDGRALVRYDASEIANADPVSGNSNPAGLIAGNSDSGSLAGSNPSDSYNLSVATFTPDSSDSDVLNDRLTYVLGQVVLREDNGNLIVGIRRSDQDRLIDFNMAPNVDEVSANNDVIYRRATPEDLSNQVFGEPQAGDIVPDSFNRPVSLSNLGANSREAITQIMASGLSGFAQRTGQTRFVVDGQIIDIAGAPMSP